MSRFGMMQIASVFLVVFLGGCSSNNKGKIEGTSWKSQAATVKGNILPAGILTLDFRNDGTLSYRAGPMTFSGKYSLGVGDRVTMDFEQELEGRKSHVETIRIEGDQLTMIDSDGTTLKFDRAKNDPPGKFGGEVEKK